MKTNLMRLTRGVGVAVWVLLSITGARATVIYNNSTNDLVTRFAWGGNELGDEIILAGTDRYLTDFSFEFYGTNTASPISFAGTPEACVKFYLNDGSPFNGYSTPSSNFFDSGWFSIGGPTARSTMLFTTADFGAGGLYMPVYSNFTWSVQFRNLG
ncbi:MAG: hypothetical protein EPO07_04650, partial [Verrucomicrobia bacterium]